MNETVNETGNETGNEAGGNEALVRVTSHRPCTQSSKAHEHVWATLVREATSRYPKMC